MLGKYTQIFKNSTFRAVFLQNNYNLPINLLLAK
nr:MAG TPA: hypothetical protein [Caudoviricetes sp.]